MRHFATKRPYLFSLGIFVITNIVALPFVLAFKVLNYDLETLRLLIPAAQSAVVIGVLHYLGWLRTAGFGGQIRDIHVLWFPLVLAFIPVLLFGTVAISAGNLLFYTLALLFTGISEEGLNRGIILNAVLSKGPWVALLFMALLFSVGHFTNLFFEDFSAFEMAEKLLITFGFAILYGAVYLRIRNIWPLIVLHILHDYAYLTSGTAGPYTAEPFPLEIHLILAILSILYAIFLMRTATEQQTPPF